MAFNPFHSFRKHQKVFMAALVFVAMFSFIGFSGVGGRGDVFGWLQEVLSGTKKDEVARLYGSSVGREEIANLGRQRRIANQYLIGALSAAMQGRAQQIMEQDKSGRMDFQMLQFQVFGDKAYQDLLKRMPRQQNASIFGGTFDLDGLIDFLIWKHQADRLNIEVTEADIKAEVAQLTNNLFNSRDNTAIEADLRRNNPGLTKEYLVSALRDEFRVRLARAALEGYEPGTDTQMPAGGTPEEFWEFYQKLRTEIDVMLFPVPVSDFVAKVPEAPPEDELKALFSKHRATPYHPESDTPGFQQPRRLQIQWLSGRTDTPLMQQAGAAELAALQVTMPQAVNLALLGEYVVRAESPDFRAPSWTDPNFALAYYPGLDLAENVAAVFGQSIGAAGTQAPLLTAALTYQAGPVARGKTWEPVVAEQTRQRVSLEAALLASGGIVTPLTMLGPVAAASQQPRFPFERVRPELLARMREQAAQHFVSALFANVQKQIEEKAKTADGRKELTPYLDELVKKYGLKTSIMEKPLSQFEIAKDPALEPLNSAFRSTMPSTRESDDLFARHFFQGDMRLYGIKHEPEIHPQFRRGWDSAPERFLYWLTKDEPLFTPASLDQVRDQVVAAWKQLKARDLAQKAADELAQQANATRGDIRELNDLEAKTKTTKITLRGVAKVKPNFQTLPTGQPQSRYKAYTEHQGKITYPPADFVEKVLTLKDQPPGTTLVLTDKPKTNYYVAVLFGQTEPSLEGFFATYHAEATIRPQGFGMMGGEDTLYAQFQQERREKYRAAFMEQLRAQAGLQIDPESRKTFEGRSEEPE